MKNKILYATKWSIISEVIAKIISPITTMILARILAQEIFGIVASITAITSLADLLSDAGFNAYIIQHQFNDEQEQLHTYNICFWSNFSLSIFLCIIIFFNRYLFSRLVGAQGYENVLIIACLVLPITSISSIELAIMKKELCFKNVGIIKIVSKIIPLLITLPLAFMKFEYWALVIGNLVGEFVTAILSIICGKFKPKKYYNITVLKKIIGFSGWAYLESILEWMLSNLAILIIGTLYGIYYLGIFKTGINIISQIMTSIYALYSNVYKSAISREQNNLEKFKNIILNFQKYTSILSIPLGIGAFLYRDFITYIMLGEKWGEAANLIGMWGLVSMLSIAFGNFYSDAIRAKGFPQKLVAIDGVYFVLLVLLLFNSVCFGINFNQFCVLYCILKIIQPLLQIFIGRKIIKINFKTIIYNCFPNIIATIGMALIIIVFDFPKSSTINTAISIVLSAIIYFILFCTTIPNKKEFIKKLKRLC